MLEGKNINLYLKKDGRKIVDNFSFTLQRGDRAVLIGEEGNGKSTLLKFLYDRRLVESYCECEGSVLARGRLAYLPQSLPERQGEQTLAAFFAGTEYYRNPGLLQTLGLSPEFLQSPQTLRSLSGGEKVKAQLARLLLDEPDVLLLDEPTNDLDIGALRWLETFLAQSRLPVLFISHDETLIERTANVILHLEQLVRKTQCRWPVAPIRPTSPTAEPPLTTRSRSPESSAAITTGRWKNGAKSTTAWSMSSGPSRARTRAAAGC